MHYVRWGEDAKPNGRLGVGMDGEVVRGGGGGGGGIEDGIVTQWHAPCGAAAVEGGETLGDTDNARRCQRESEAIREDAVGQAALCGSDGGEARTVARGGVVSHVRTSCSGNS